MLAKKTLKRLIDILDFQQTPLSIAILWDQMRQIARRTVHLAVSDTDFVETALKESGDGSKMQIFLSLLSTSRAINFSVSNMISAAAAV